MDPLFGGLLTGGMSLFGNLMGQSNNQQMMQQQQAFQTMMSNTAYQRASKDMTAAGLNPMMMFSSGSAASTPAGATPMQSPMTNLGDAAQKAISTSVQMKTMNATVDNLIQQNANLKASQALTEADRRLRGAQTATEEERPMDVKMHALYNANQAGREGNLMPEYRNRGQKGQNELDLRETPLGKILDQGGAAGRSIDDIISPVGNLLSSAKAARRLSTTWDHYN